MENLVICKAETSDSKEIIELIHKAMTQYVKISNIPANLASLKETEKDIEKYIKSDHVLKAVIKGKIVATIRVSRHDDKTAQISRFAVLPGMQKWGIGNKLFSEAEKYLIQCGISKVFLYTALENFPNVRFYESKGFSLMETSYDRKYPRGRFVKYI